jgi:hypothetical protein
MDDNEEEPSGALYQLNDTGCIRRDPGYVVTNGPAESPDGSVLYHTDTLAGMIYAFDRTRTGSLSNKRIFARFSPGSGYPDGPIVDAEGCLWTGVFGGWGLQALLAARRAVADHSTAVFRGHQGGLRRRRSQDALHHYRARGARCRTAPAATARRAACSARGSTCRDCHRESCRMASDEKNPDQPAAASARATGSTTRNISTWWRCISSAS